MDYMRKTIKFFGAAVMVMTVASCFKDPVQTEPGSLEIRIERGCIPGTRSSIPDVDDFTLTISDEDGADIYKGRFGDSPESILVDAGTYTVNIVSGDVRKPGFDNPVYGDTQIVVVPSGGKTSVNLCCYQINGGIRLDVRDSFEETFPTSILMLKSVEGRLEYGYDETRTAFFPPGTVSLGLEGPDGSETLFTRTLEARQMLTVELSADTGASTAGISVQLDTARNWTEESFCYGERGSGDNGIGSAYSVEEAKGHIGQKDVWVCGYIVGSFNSSSGPSFTGPFTKTTNIVIAGRSGTTDKAYCISVELKSGPIRDALNLCNNPSNLGKQVYLRGDLVEAYYGMDGIKQLTEYQWK